MATCSAKAIEEKQPFASNVLRAVGTIGVLGGAINSLPATMGYITAGFGPIQEEICQETNTNSYAIFEQINKPILESS